MIPGPRHLAPILLFALTTATYAAPVDPDTNIDNIDITDLGGLDMDVLFDLPELPDIPGLEDILPEEEDSVRGASPEAMHEFTYPQFQPTESHPDLQLLQRHSKSQSQQPPEITEDTLQDIDKNLELVFNENPVWRDVESGTASSSTNKRRRIMPGGNGNGNGNTLMRSNTPQSRFGSRDDMNWMEGVAFNAEELQQQQQQQQPHQPTRPPRLPKPPSTASLQSLRGISPPTAHHRSPSPSLDDPQTRARILALLSTQHTHWQQLLHDMQTVSHSQMGEVIRNQALLNEAMRENSDRTTRELRETARRNEELLRGVMRELEEKRDGE